jgi:hypothetical protein
MLMLRKVLYMLHQAPHAWNAKLDDTLLSLGLRRTPLEQTIYIRQNDNVQLVVRVYVNDFVITDSDYDDIKSFKEEKVVMFKMSNLGIEVKQSSERNFSWPTNCLCYAAPRELRLGEMQSRSNTHGGMLEAKQAKHATPIG